MKKQNDPPRPQESACTCLTCHKPTRFLLLALDNLALSLLSRVCRAGFLGDGCAQSQSWRECREPTADGRWCPSAVLPGPYSRLFHRWGRNGAGRSVGISSALISFAWLRCNLRVAALPGGGGGSPSPHVHISCSVYERKSSGTKKTRRLSPFRPGIFRLACLDSTFFSLDQQAG